MRLRRRCVCPVCALRLPDIMNQLRNAKLELKKSQRKDYYKIMGVSKDASESEIKTAYKRLALKYHPGRTDCSAP